MNAASSARSPRQLTGAGFAGAEVDLAGVDVVDDELEEVVDDDDVEDEVAAAGSRPVEPARLSVR